MTNSLNAYYRECRHWIDIVVFILIGGLYLYVWSGAFARQPICEQLWTMVVPIAKDGIAAGMTVTSILISAVVAMIVFIRGKSDPSVHIARAVVELSLAAGILILSLGVALFNFSHLPFRIKANIHISFDWVVGSLTILQFVLIFLGIWKILRGAYYFSKDGFKLAAAENVPEVAAVTEQGVAPEQSGETSATAPVGEDEAPSN
jgi:hypothetical protein